MSSQLAGRETRERLLRVAVLFVVLIVATVLRTWRLEQLPPGLYHDEAYNGLDALSLTQGRIFPQFYEGWELYAAEAHDDRPAQESRWPVFFEGNYGREPLHIYLMAAAIELLGVRVLSIRVVPALAGILGVLTTYLAARELGRRNDTPEVAGDQQSLFEKVLLDPPPIAALALAILFPAVHFSRFGIRAMLFVPLATLTVTFFWRGINKARAVEAGETKRKSAVLEFALAGVLLGLSLYSYAAARLFPLVFVGFVPYWFWRDRHAIGRHWRHIAIMAGVAFLTALPLLLFFVRYPYYFIFRIAYVANKGKGVVEGRPWLTWLSNLGRVAGGLFVKGETHLRHNLPGRPFMDPIQSGLFIMGAVVTIRQRARLAWVFLWIWFVVMLLPSILSGDAPHFGRLIGIAPVLAIFIGLGFVGLVNSIAKRLPGHKSLVIGMLGLLLLASAVWTTADYFGRYAKQPDLRDAFYEPDWELGSYLAEYPDDTNLYLTPSQEELATLYYALGAPERLTNYTGSAGIVPAGFPGQPRLYAVRAMDAGYIERLKDLLPGGRLEERGSEILTYLVEANASHIELANEASADWAGQIGLHGWEAEVRDQELMVSLAWRALEAPTQEYTAFVHLLNADGEIIAQVDRPPLGYSTANWRMGEIVVDEFLLVIPSDYQGEETKLVTGFYDSTTQVLLDQPIQLGRMLNGEFKPGNQ